MSNVFSLNNARAVATREDKGTIVPLRDEQGDPLLCLQPDGSVVEGFIRQAGRLSTRYRMAEQRINDRTIKRRTTELTAEFLERNELEKLALCAMEWNLTDGGTPIELTVDNVIQVLRAAPWIRADLEKSMSDPSRFLD